MFKISNCIMNLLLKYIVILIGIIIMISIMTGLVYADSVQQIEFEEIYTGTISEDVRGVIEYYTGNVGYDGMIYVDENYIEFSIKADETAFYSIDKFIEEENGVCNFLVLDENKRNITGMWSEYSDSFMKEYVFLEKGKIYKLVITPNWSENYKFKITNVGNEIEENNSFTGAYVEENLIDAEQKIKLTSEGLLSISGKGYINLIDIASKISDMSYLVKSIEIKGNIQGIVSDGDRYVDEYAGVDGVFANTENINIFSNIKKVAGVPFIDMDKLKTINFYCNAPEILSLKQSVGDLDLLDILFISEDEIVGDPSIFEGITAEVHYPAGCKSWNNSVCKNYGGNITWIADENIFIDVTPDNWFYNEVQFVSKNNYMNGVGNGLFAPNKAISRAMLATVLYRINGEEEINNKVSFKDISKNAYYTDAVAWAVANGIMTGKSDEKFAPNDNATRQEMTSAMYKYAEYLGKDVSNKADLNQFKDASILVSYGIDAKDAFAWAVGNGIVSGTSETHLSPNGNASRAQFATILQRFLQNFN